MRTSPILLAGVMLIAACGSGSDEATEPTTPAETAAATTPATEPAATVPAATEPPVETTTTTTTTTPTTLAPTTTIDPVAQLRADIERDLNLGEQALLNAGADPNDPKLLEALKEHYVGDSLEVVTAIVETLKREGNVVRRNAETPASYHVIGMPIFPDPDQPEAALVRTCRIDSGIVVQEAGETDIIVNDVTTRFVSDSEVVRIDGTWKLRGGSIAESTPGALICVDS